MPDTESWHFNTDSLAIMTIVMDHITIPVLDQKSLQQCCSQFYSSAALFDSLLQSRILHQTTLVNSSAALRDSLLQSRNLHQTTLVNNLLTAVTTMYHSQLTYRLWRMTASMATAADQGVFQPQEMKSLQQCCTTLHHSVELSRAMNLSMHMAWALEIHHERDLEAHNLEDSSEDEDLGPWRGLWTAGQWMTIRELGRLQYPPGSSPDSSNSSEWSEIHWRD